VPLTVTADGLSLECIVFRQDAVLSSPVTDTVAQFSIQLVAADPRKFSDPLTTSTRLPASTGGLTVPFTVPFTIASTVVSGTCSLVNGGNTTGPVRLRVNGPCTGPIITHVGTGAQLVFASSLVLAAGEWIDIDMGGAHGSGERHCQPQRLHHATRLVRVRTRRERVGVHRTGLQHRGAAECDRNPGVAMREI